jgi:signal transduction histidine kinase
MGEMISMIAHQWRQPLNIISTAATDLDLKIQFGTLDEKLCQKNIEKINELTQYLSNTIDDFRSFFKTEKKREETTIDAIVDDTLNIIKEYVENKKITIVTDLHNGIRFHTYPNELKQVLLNLLNNAEDALKTNRVADARITIRTWHDDSDIHLEICDNAGGIPETVFPHIFDAYFTTKSERNGTGLGLYMSKMIVEEHCGGRLEAYNRKEGACFRISLPREPRKGERDQKGS